MFFPCFVNLYLLLFLVCSHLDERERERERERAGCFTSIVFMMYCDC